MEIKVTVKTGILKLDPVVDKLEDVGMIISDVAFC